MLGKTYIAFIVSIFLVVNWELAMSQNTELSSPWDNHRYNLEDNKSPYDKLRVDAGLTLNWKDANPTTVSSFLVSVGKMYPETLNPELISTDKFQLQRHIIHDNKEVTILEKTIYSHGVVLYFKNGIAEKEMNFYRLLTKYYPEK